MTVKETMLRALERKISVIPVGKNKRPLLEWKEYQTKLATPDEINLWDFSWKDMQMGIVTGKISNLTVVDIDNPNYDLSKFPETMTIKTGSGGYHLYYQFYEMPNKARILPDVDIRSEGGYCFTSGHRVAVVPKNERYKHTKSIKIENLKVGDFVKTFNENTGQIENNKIIRIGKRLVSETNIIKFGNRQGHLQCTPEHPIYTTEGWKQSGEIIVDDELIHFDRKQLLFGKAGYTFKKGIQNRIGKNGGNYKENYIQKRPANIKHKSNYEKFIISLIKKENLPITFCGDGSIVIKHEKEIFIPDFIVDGKKKVIEIHCDFHNKNRKYKSLEERREIYKKEGWECLIINATKWAINENFLENIEEIRKKLIIFSGNGKKVIFNHKIYEDIFVYNIEVEKNHNYFISSPAENKQDWYLVHNCVAPPSSNEKGKYTVIKNKAWQPFPAYLFQDKPTEKTYIKTEYTGFSQGQRNQEMTKYIGHLLAKVHPSEWETIAWSIIQEANQKNTPPISEYELKTIFQSIQGKEKGNKTDRWYKQIVKPEIKIKTNYPLRYTWGTANLDDNLAILKRGNFVIVGAKQSQGKTAYTFDMAYKNALAGHKVLYLSLEMEEEVLKDDIGRKYAGWTIPEEYNNIVPQRKKEAYNRKLEEISSVETLIFKSLRRGDSPQWNNIIKVINETPDVDLIFIDNLDLIDGEPGQDNTERQKQITKKIMNFTAEYKVPLILIHHHRKSMGKDYGADELTGSGKIKDNADIILKISRNTDPDASYPDKYISRIYQQKGRGYPDTIQTVYFIKGTFCDVPPIFEK